jgi:hypothetical protein
MPRPITSPDYGMNDLIDTLGTSLVDTAADVGSVGYKVASGGMIGLRDALVEGAVNAWRALNPQKTQGQTNDIKGNPIDF